MNICNHSQAGAIALSPGAAQACGVGLAMARCPCEIPRSLSCHGETETGGKIVSFPRVKQKTRLLQTSPAASDGEPRAPGECS